MKIAITGLAVVLSELQGTSSAFVNGAGIEWEILHQEVMELHRVGNYDRAVIVAREALKTAQANVGSDHPDVATSLHGLAELYREQGLYAKAEPLYKHSLAIFEKARGARSFGALHTGNQLRILAQ